MVSIEIGTFYGLLIWVGGGPSLFPIQTDQVSIKQSSCYNWLAISKVRSI